MLHNPARVLHRVYQIDVVGCAPKTQCILPINIQRIGNKPLDAFKLAPCATAHFKLFPPFQIDRWRFVLRQSMKDHIRGTGRVVTRNGRRNQDPGPSGGHASSQFPDDPRRTVLMKCHSHLLHKAKNLDGMAQTCSMAEVSDRVSREYPCQFCVRPRVLAHPVLQRSFAAIGNNHRLSPLARCTRAVGLEATPWIWV